MPMAMQSARFAAAYDWRHPSRQQRTAALILTLAISALVLLALLSIAASPKKPAEKPVPTVTFDLPAPSAAAKSPDKSKSRTTETQAAAAPVTLPPQPKSPIIVPIKPPPIPTKNTVFVSKDEYAAMDIGKLPKSGGAQGPGTAGKSAFGPGEGPGGATLYPAEWYQRPARGALAAYLPEGAPPGSWAMIACKTVPRYHVDNCVGLGQSHQGLSAALRQAAWQFLVQPPRVDGKPLIGVWVRIRFDFTEKE